MPMAILGPRMDGDFLAVYVDIDEAWLPRPHAARSWEPHITLGNVSSYGLPPGVVLDLVSIVRQRWVGQQHMTMVE